MNSKNENLFNQIKRGREGLNQGLPTGLSKLDEDICGIQRSRYDLVFAREKAGKSAFVNSCYILNPYDYLHKKGKTKDLKVFYFSLEMSETAVLSKWYADKIFREDKILIDSNIVLSKGDNYFNDDLLKLAEKHIPYFDEMLNTSVDLQCGQTNPTGIYKHVKTWLLENGTWENGYYKPNNPEITVIIIADTAGNLKLEKVEGIASLKTTIDKLSEYFREFRDKYNCTPVMIMHTNRATDNYNRDADNDLLPKTSDIKETGQCVQDNQKFLIFVINIRV